MCLHKTCLSTVLTNCSDASAPLDFIYALRFRQLIQNTVFRHISKNALQKSIFICDFFLLFFFHAAFYVKSFHICISNVMIALVIFTYLGSAFEN